MGGGGRENGVAWHCNTHGWVEGRLVGKLQQAWGAAASDPDVTRYGIISPSEASWLKRIARRRPPTRPLPARPLLHLSVGLPAPAPPPPPPSPPPTRGPPAPCAAAACRPPVAGGTPASAAAGARRPAPWPERQTGARSPPAHGDQDQDQDRDRDRDRDREQGTRGAYGKKGCDAPSTTSAGLIECAPSSTPGVPDPDPDPVIMPCTWLSSTSLGAGQPRRRVCLREPSDPPPPHTHKQPFSHVHGTPTGAPGRPGPPQHRPQLAPPAAPASLCTAPCTEH